MTDRCKDTIDWVDLVPDVDPRERTFGALPDAIDFNIIKEAAYRNGQEVAGQHWIVRTDTDKVLHTAVGDSFTTVSHADRFRGMQDVLLENMPEHDLLDAKVTYKTARGGEWAMMDIILPNVRIDITTRKHLVSVAERFIAWSGLAGTCSNNALFGAIDFFCTNGQISGEYDTIRKRNSASFTLDGLLGEVRDSKDGFINHTKRLQQWADTPITYHQAFQVIEAVIPSERGQKAMMVLFDNEVYTRGANAYALYSAFTNYSSHEAAGAVRNTGKDTRAVSMWKRECDVVSWTHSDEFRNLLDEDATVALVVLP